MNTQCGVDGNKYLLLDSFMLKDTYGRMQVTVQVSANSQPGEYYWLIVASQVDDN